MGDDYQSPITEDMDEFGKIIVESLCCNQSLIHSAYDSPEGIADSDLEDEQLRKMPASPLYIQKRDRDFNSSRKHRVSGKPDAKFSFDSEPTLNTFLARNRGNEPGDQFESIVHSVLRFADTSNAGGSILEGNKDHLLNQARSNLTKQESQVESLNSCINELQQQASTQRLELQDAHNGYIGPRREQSRAQEKLSMKEKVLRETQIRNRHEMAEMKRAQDLRVDESLYKN